MNENTIVNEVAKLDHEKVRVAVCDIDGILRGKYIYKNKFLSAIQSGFGFCNVVFGWDSADVCYDNSDYTGWHTGYPDAKAKIDLSTYRKIPWNKKLPFFLADFINEDGSPLEICPRQLLKRVIKKGKEMGYAASFGLEFEWFNFDETPESLSEKAGIRPKPLTPGMFGYSILRSSMRQEYFNDLMDELLAFDIPIEGLHTETGPGVYEAAILYADALEAADRGVLFKTAVKEIAMKHKITPSFMARWNTSLPGCSGHVHQSIWDLKKEKNLFYDEAKPHKMSDLYRHYLAGQMACLPEILPFFAPTVNSYKRLVEGYWAPTRVTWGVENRTVAFRVIPGSNQSTRLETRVPGSDTNSYLAVAAALASGLYGIENKLELTSPPVKGNGYLLETAERLPINLYDATLKMRESKIARQLFGDTFIEHFANTRIWEWRESQKAVTDWELKRYFEII